MSPPPVHSEDPSRVRLAELIAALSLATDLGMGQPMEHALRSCVLAVRLGETLGLGYADLRDIYYLALLRFLGCTADAHVTASVFGDDVATSGWYATVDAGRPLEALQAWSATWARVIRHFSGLGCSLPRSPGCRA